MKAEAMPAFRRGEITADEFYEIDGMTPADYRHKQYQRLAGEAEARNVQTRQDFTPEQRRAQAPWTTLDVPEDELIVRR